MSVVTNQTVVIIVQDSLGNITATYTVGQGSTDFPGQTVNRLSGTLVIPGGDSTVASDLIAQAKTAAGV